MGARGVRGGSWNESLVDTQGMTTWVGEIFCQITEVLKSCLVPETQLTMEGKMRDTFRRRILFLHVFIWCRYGISKTNIKLLLIWLLVTHQERHHLDLTPILLLTISLTLKTLNILQSALPI